MYCFVMGFARTTKIIYYMPDVTFIQKYFHSALGCVEFVRYCVAFHFNVGIIRLTDSTVSGKPDKAIRENSLQASVAVIDG